MTITAEQVREAVSGLTAVDGDVGRKVRLHQYITETEAALAAKDAEIARLRQALCQIHEAAHNYSIGTVAPNGYWNLRDMAAFAIDAARDEK